MDAGGDFTIAWESNPNAGSSSSSSSSGYQVYAQRYVRASLLGGAVRPERGNRRTVPSQPLRSGRQPTLAEHRRRPHRRHGDRLDQQRAVRQPVVPERDRPSFLASVQPAIRPAHRHGRADRCRRSQLFGQFQHSGLQQPVGPSEYDYPHRPHEVHRPVRRRPGPRDQGERCRLVQQRLRSVQLDPHSERQRNQWRRGQRHLPVGTDHQRRRALLRGRGDLQCQWRLGLARGPVRADGTRHDLGPEREHARRQLRRHSRGGFQSHLLCRHFHDQHPGSGRAGQSGGERQGPMGRFGRLLQPGNEIGRPGRG